MHCNLYWVQYCLICSAIQALCCANTRLLCRSSIVANMQRVLGWSGSCIGPAPLAGNRDGRMGRRRAFLWAGWPRERGGTRIWQLCQIQTPIPRAPCSQSRPLRSCLAGLSPAKQQVLIRGAPSVRMGLIPGLGEKYPLAPWWVPG